MKFTIAISLCLALIQLGNAQNAETLSEATTIVEPSTPEIPTSPLPLEPKPETVPVAPPVKEPTAQELPTPSATESVPQEIKPEPTVVVNTTTSTPNNETKPKFVEKLSDQIRSILKHFHDPEPVGFPGQQVLPDPMSVPNKTSDLGLGTAEFYNLSVHGLSNFTVDAVNMLLDEMQVYVMIRLQKVIVRGNFTFETAISNSKGPFNMTLTNVTAEGTVHLKVDAEGKLHASRSATGLQYETLTIGSNASAIQTALNIAGIAFLEAIKPDILSQIDQLINNEVNRHLESSPKIPSIANMSPVDKAILEGRQFVRRTYEPFTIKNVVDHDSEFLNVKIGPVTINGLSKFARVGNITIQMREGVVQLVVRLITGRLKGNCSWFYDFGKVGVTKKGESLFYIEHLQFEAKINQSINLRKKPILDDLQLEVGRTYVKMDGSTDFDYIIEMVVQLMPNMLRHLIVDSFEEQIKNTVQTEVLDKINVEQMIENNLSLIEDFFVY